MVDYGKILDVVVGALAKPAQPGAAAEVRTAPGGATADQLLQKARDAAAQHPVLTQAALLGLAGLMFGKGRQRGIPETLARWGGLALIGGLAYGAYRTTRPAAAPGSAASGAAEGSPGQAGTTGPALPAPPEASRFHPVSQTEDDVLLYVRTMVAAAAADGRIDKDERARIARGLAEAGIDPESTHWLEREMQSPADVDELAAGADDPERAAQVYAAALLAIDPDTLQEHEFLRRLAEALDIDQALRTQIEETIGAAR